MGRGALSMYNDTACFKYQILQGEEMNKIFAVMALGVSVFSAQSAMAETCGGTYTVQSGDSLSVIADKLYKDAGKWSVIHNRNITAIGPKPNAIQVGMKLNLTCIDGLPVGLEGGRSLAEAVPTEAEPMEIEAGTAAVRHKINLLTGGNYRPFTDQSLHNGGFLHDLVNASMEASAPEQGYAIHWVDDWSAHFDPLLSNALLDAGFPWFKPYCDEVTNNYRCDNLLFSEPLFEALRLLFVDASNPLTFENDEDLYNKRFCVPKEYDTSLFDAQGRNWLRDGKITVVEGLSPADCIRILVDGGADGAVLNEFIGRAAIKEIGVTDRVQIVPQPLSIDALHLVVHKSHPEADQILGLINDGLHKIHDDGTYQAIVEDHLARIWAGF